MQHGVGVCGVYVSGVDVIVVSMYVSMTAASGGECTGDGRYGQRASQKHQHSFASSVKAQASGPW